MKSTAKKKKLSADEIAEKAMSGEDISQFFTDIIRTITKQFEIFIEQKTRMAG